MSLETNRRSFILNSFKIASSAAAMSVLGGCATIEEYLFEDTYNLKDQTVIVGGGIAGMFLAHQLRQNKMSFRIFEGSNRLGGRIRSEQNIDYGASIYSNADQKLKGLIKEYNLLSASLDRNHLYLTNGMQDLVTAIEEVISGLITYRSVRLRWKLISIQKINNLFEVVFESPRGRRTFVSQKVGLAIPPSQWAGIKGLYELTEMQALKDWAAGIRKENTFKAVLTSQQSVSFASGTKALSFYEDDAFSARQVIKKNKSTTWVEVDLTPKVSSVSVEIEKINDFLKKKMNLNFSSAKMTTENYFDWSQISLIQGATFTSEVDMPEVRSLALQVVGDFTRKENSGRIEGALQSAHRAAEILLS